MKLTPERQLHIWAALDDVVAAAMKARQQQDLTLTKAALNNAWHAIRDAREIITDIESATRREALAKLETEA